MAKASEEKHIVVSVVARQAWDEKKLEHDYKNGKSTKNSEFMIILLKNYEVKP